VSHVEKMENFLNAWRRRGFSTTRGLSALAQEHCDSVKTRQHKGLLSEATCTIESTERGDSALMTSPSSGLIASSR
jgi:hypothetical protein